MKKIVCVSQCSGENGDMERESVCLCGGSGVDERGTSGSVVPFGGVSIVPVMTISRVRSGGMVFVVI